MKGMALFLCFYFILKAVFQFYCIFRLGKTVLCALDDIIDGYRCI